MWVIYAPKVGYFLADPKYNSGRNYTASMTNARRFATAEYAQVIADALPDWQVRPLDTFLQPVEGE